MTPMPRPAGRPDGRPDGRQRCGRKKKSDGTPCTQWPIKGATHCRVHGGGRKSPSDKAADRRLTKAKVEREAARMLGKAGEGDHPVVHLLDELYRSAAVVLVLGRLVADLDQVEQEIDRTKQPTKASGLLARRTTGEGAVYAVVHPLVEMWNAERDRRAKLAKMAIDAGVAEAQLKLAEQQADLLVRVIEATIADPELGMDPGRQRTARGVAARHLRVLDGAA